MSFFIRTNNSIKQNTKFLKKENKGKKRKAEGNVSKKNKHINDEEIESEDEEPVSEIVKEGKGDAYESDDNYETAQEKKLRLAKIYLEEIERKEKRLKEIGEVDKEDITNYLKEDLKEKASKNRKIVSDFYSGYDEANIKMLRCKDQRLPLTCVVVSFDDKFIYSGSKDPGIVKWSLQSGQKLKSVRDKKNTDGSKKSLGKILCLAISSDNKFLVSGSSNNEIVVWNPVSLEFIHTFSGHKGAVTGVVFQKNQHTLFSSSADKSVKVWNLSEMTYVESLFGHQKSVTSIDALLAERAITSGEDSSVHLWKIIEESQLIYNANGSVESVKFINEEYFLSGGTDGSLCLWGVLKKRPLFTVSKAHGTDPKNFQPNWITSVAALVNTDLVASGSCDGVIRLWKCCDNFKNLELLFEIPLKGFINGISFTSDGNYLIVAVSKEHRLGRWWKLDEVKNHVCIIPLIKKS